MSVSQMSNNWRFFTCWCAENSRVVGCTGGRSMRRETNWKTRQDQRRVGESSRIYPVINWENNAIKKDVTHSFLIKSDDATESNAMQTILVDTNEWHHEIYFTHKRNTEGVFLKREMCWNVADPRVTSECRQSTMWRWRNFEFSKYCCLDGKKRLWTTWPCFFRWATGRIDKKDTVKS